MCGYCCALKRGRKTERRGKRIEEVKMVVIKDVQLCYIKVIFKLWTLKGKKQELYH